MIGWKTMNLMIGWKTMKTGNVLFGTIKYSAHKLTFVRSKKKNICGKIIQGKVQ